VPIRNGVKENASLMRRVRGLNDIMISIGVICGLLGGEPDAG